MSGIPEIQRVTDCLSAHPLFRCGDDPEETCARVAQVFRPHQFGVIGPHQRLNTQMDQIDFGRVSLNRLSYESRISVASDPMENFLMVMMPLRGLAEVEYGGQRICATPLQPVVISATQPLAMRWQDNCDQLIVRIARDAIEDACATQLGHALERPLTFDLAMNPDAQAMSAWRRLLACLVCDEAFVRSALDHPMVGAQAEQLLISALLVGQQHNHRSELDKPERASTPVYVRRAEEYMHAHIHEDITMDSVVRFAGVSARSLFAGFQRYRGTSPMAYLRDLRLDKVRQDLLNARQQYLPHSVTDTALQWGFGHLSHFTRAYEARFHELPSQTLYGLRYRQDASEGKGVSRKR